MATLPSITLKQNNTENVFISFEKFYQFIICEGVLLLFDLCFCLDTKEHFSSRGIPMIVTSFCFSIYLQTLKRHTLLNGYFKEIYVQTLRLVTSQTPLACQDRTRYGGTLLSIPGGKSKPCSSTPNGEKFTT